MVANIEYKIAECSIIPDLLLVRIAQEEHRIEPRLMAVLVYLIEHSQSLITREDLIRDVWQGQVVSDNAINRTIAQLRKLLGDTPSRAKIIETIPKKGYRLIAPVEAICNKTEQSQAPGSAESLIDNTNHEDNTENNQGFNNLVWRSSLAIALTAILIIWLSPKQADLEQSEVSFTPSNAIPVTSLSGVEAYPAFSSNGHWLAYSHQPETDANWNILIQSLEDNRQYSLTHKQGLNVNPVFAKNSSLMAFTRWNNINERKCSIHLIDLSATLSSLNMTNRPTEDSSRLLVNCGTRALPRVSWHPRQNSFYYFDREQITQPYTVYKYYVDTGKKEQVTLPPQGEQGHYWVEVSPSGKQLAVLSYIDANQSEILIIDEASLQIEKRVPIDSYINRVNWLNNSQLLLHMSNQLKQISIDSISNNEPIELKNFPLEIADRFIQPQLSQDSTHLALVEMWQEQNIWQASLETLNSASEPNHRELLIESSRNDYSPKFAHNSDQIAFFSSRSGKVQIWLLGQDKQLKQVTNFTQGLNFSPLRWSHDDRFLLFTFDKSIYQLSVHDGTLTKVIDSEFGAYNYVYSVNNKFVIASSKRSGDWQLWRLPITEHTNQSEIEAKKNQSETVQLTFSGGYGPRVSSDGQWIYFTKFHQDGLWRIPSAGGAEELITDNFSKLNWLHWQLVDDGAYYLDISHEIPGIYFFSFENKSRKLALSKQADQSNDFSISQQSKKIVFSKTDSQKGDIYLVKLDQEVK
ncbi:MAG: winged helix-turn-helix domain-containing protein [Kangiellaceae bacterium]|nr:winged helix-turn-helix domain-containing protein [Kangiellaceae bacterium]